MPGNELFYEDVDIGDEIGPIEKTVTSERVHEFVRVWGRGLQPSRFTDPEVAREERLPGPILPGVMNIAMLSQLLTDWSPSVTLKKLDVVFRQVVLHNIPLQVKGTITDKNVVGGEPQIECDVFLENADGERLVGGKAVVVLPMRGGRQGEA